jgi:hypothetical protein
MIPLYLRPNSGIPSLIAAPSNAKSNELAAKQAAALKAKVTENQKLKEKLAAAKDKNAKLVKDAKANKKVTKTTSLDGSVSGSIVAGNDSPPAPVGQYFYNPPMISYNYFRDEGPQSDFSNVSNAPGNFGRGIDAWTNRFGSKGVIQMSKARSKDYSTSSDPNSNTFDGNLYGFKFMYNPSEVTMNWGLGEGMNLEGIAAGLGVPGSVAITQSLKYSSISFSLLLNRVSDMAFLNANGLKPDVVDPYTTFQIAPNSNKNRELANIYKRGTMYDLEYLFRTIMGINATNRFLLQGETADRGWLAGTQVELHLGDGFRYLVRVTNLEVKHAIFNDRMVPTLSYINLELSRFNEMARD